MDYSIPGRRHSKYKELEVLRKGSKKLKTERSRELRKAP